MVPMTLPECPNGHGQMEFAKAATREQDFCGTWYRCPRCLSSTLFRSAELDAQLAALAA